MYITKDEIVDFLKKELTIELSVDTGSSPGYIDIQVNLKLSGERIDYDRFYGYINLDK